MSLDPYNSYVNFTLFSTYLQSSVHNVMEDLVSYCDCYSDSHLINCSIEGL